MPKENTLLRMPTTIFFFFWLHRTVHGILVTQPGIEPSSPAVTVQSLNHWAARKVSNITFKTKISKPFAICNTDLSSELLEKGKSANCVILISGMDQWTPWKNFSFWFIDWLSSSAVRSFWVRPVLCGGSHCRRTTVEAACAVYWQAIYRWCAGIFYT